MTPEEAHKIARYHLGDTLTTLTRGGPTGDDWIAIACHGATEVSARAPTVDAAARDAADQLRAGGWVPTHARLEWERDGASPLSRRLPMPLDLDEIRALLASPAPVWRIPMGINDRNGRPVHLGDRMVFADAREWGGDHPPKWTMQIKDGEISHPGGASDIPSYCEVIEQTGTDPVALVAALLSEVDRLTAEAAAKDAEVARLTPVIEWRQMLDGRTAEITTWASDAGDASLRVAEKQWRTRSFPGWTGEKPGWAVVFGRTYVAASGPETGDAGKAACEAAYRRACGLSAP